MNKNILSALAVILAFGTVACGGSPCEDACENLEDIGPCQSGGLSANAEGSCSDACSEDDGSNDTIFECQADAGTCEAYFACLGGSFTDGMTTATSDAGAGGGM
ncbi:MAG: hypothetical protein AAGA56_24865 [Myxococcota bacterium]